MAIPSVLSMSPALAAAVVVCITTVAIYRLFFHPLAKYPGPTLAKLSQWPEARSAWQGRRHLDLYLLHEKYGDVVRFSPDKLSFRTVGALQDIYTDRRANVIKTGWTATGLRINPGITTHSLSDRELHAKRRRLLNNAFSDSALRNLEPYLLEAVREWCDHLSEPRDDDGSSGWSEERDMSTWSTLFIVDVFGDLCFGAKFGAMKKGSSYILELLMSSVRFQQCLSFLPIREFLFPFMTPRILKATGNKTFKQRTMYREDVGKLVQERFALEKANAEKSPDEQRKDLFHYLMQAKDPRTSEVFRPQDLVGEAALLLGAGSDTSSTTLSGCFWYLMRSPRVLKRLQDEVRSSFDDVEDIRWGTKLSSLTYLRACIDEALRIAPSVPGYLDRLVLAGGAVIDGHFVPEGAVVGVTHYAIHHNPEYYSRPFEFLPERWLAGPESSAVTGFDVTPESVEVAKSAFHAFLSGPRSCVGKNMAYMELSIAIARVIWLFDIRLKQGDHSGEGRPGWEPGRERVGEYQLKDWLIADREGPVLEFKKSKISQV
ncbi:hypothetical protein PV11_09935 [Exophiala sideris]|uniref:Uncharacterized protein n=1 Tax=Exophiala sideris TaxID=1016849 RepID=A0A0D1VQ26_9EURO|nr:hypothetical protein PV11_09935 [Exophiala sideris]